MKYSIVIPTYNHCEDFLKPCIKSILDNSIVSDIELIISANGCTDNTLMYCGSLKEKFDYLGLQNNIKIVWSMEPLGYPKAVNAGMSNATCDKIVLLNNDTVILNSPKNTWLKLLEKPFEDNQTGITGIIKNFSQITKSEFVIFFCTMIDKKVIDKIGLLDEDFGIGGNEDIDYCKRASMAGFTISQAMPLSLLEEQNIYTGSFPIYHKGEGTMNDPSLVSDWKEKFHRNEMLLARKYGHE